MKQNKNFDKSRRSFLKWSAATASLATGLTGCSSSDGETFIVGGGGAQDKPAALLTGGKWVTVPCADCSTGRCINRAYIVDGIPVRQKTEDSRAFSDQFPLYRPCLKGRGIRWSIFSPGRLKYPMKRKNWKPGGGVTNSTPHLRGKDEWVRITWKEALDLAAEELKRIVTMYGTKSYTSGWPPPSDFAHLDPEYGKNVPVLNLSYTMNMEPRFLNATNYGSIPIWGQNSTGAWPVVRSKMGAEEAADMWGGDRLTVQRHSNTIVLWGNNPSWVKYGIPQHTFKRAKERGCKVICVDPWVSPGNSALVDEWIPCRPGTDNALLLAVAHELISNNWVDEDFLGKYTVGYDHLSMPLYQKDNTTPILDKNGVSVIANGAWGPNNSLSGNHHKDWQNNFKDYVLGTYDGQPKNAAWATKICGTPVNKIKLLAQYMGKPEHKPMALLASNAPARTYQGARFVQAFYTVGWMTGNVGKPGGRVDVSGNAHFAGNSYSGSFGSYYDEEGAYYFGQYSPWGGDAALRRSTVDQTIFQPSNPKAALSYGSWGYSDFHLINNYQSDRYYGIAFAEIWDAIINKKHHNFVHGMKDVNIKAILKLHLTNCGNQVVNTNKAVKAFRDPNVDFVFVHERYLTTTARYADIILPCTTGWEDDGHYNMLNPELFIGNAERVIEPLFEAKSSADVDSEMCKRFEVNPLFGQTDGMPLKQVVFNKLANTWVITPDGTGKEYLISFTQADINEIGAVCGYSDKMKKGRITYQEFKEKGYYQVRMNDNLIKQGVSSFIQDPASNPLNDTETGKMEIYSMGLARYYKNFGFEQSINLDPIGKYAVSPNGYEESQAGSPDGQKYPYMYVSTHPLHRLHSARTDNQNILEVIDDILWINPMDAANSGLKNGDTALLTSDTGKILRRVSITQTVMPGVIIGIEGSTTRYNEDESIDMGGNANILCKTLLCGEGHQAYNTVIVKMEKWTGTPLQPQYKWPIDNVDV